MKSGNGEVDGWVLSQSLAHTSETPESGPKEDAPCHGTLAALLPQLELLQEISQKLTYHSSFSYVASLKDCTVERRSENDWAVTPSPGALAFKHLSAVTFDTPFAAVEYIIRHSLN